MSQKDGDQMTIMEAWQQTSPWGVEHNSANGWAKGVGGHSFPARNFCQNHENITSVVSELCWPPLNSETVKIPRFYCIACLSKLRSIITSLATSGGLQGWSGAGF